ncbi:MAG: 5-formyltetrahydrofolate cyclo-ligase [Pararhodobacter sp.]|nr:5-formyltetrahydrofolate cyclo-ligase [Pararhodobacter sp.]
MTAPHDPDIDTLKAEARRSALVARQAAHARQPDPAAQAHLRAALAMHAGAPLAGYMPMRTEIDPLPAMASHEGPVGVPVIVARGQALAFHRWTPDCPLVEGPFGARVPADGVPLVPRVLIVPLLAFDARGYRLGYGGGFYDRTLAALRAAGPVTALGFAYAAQEIPDLPIDDFDQRLDAVVTEGGIRHFTA